MKLILIIFGVYFLASVCAFFLMEYLSTMIQGDFPVVGGMLPLVTGVFTAFWAGTKFLAYYSVSSFVFLGTVVLGAKSERVFLKLLPVFVWMVFGYFFKILMF